MVRLELNKGNVVENPVSRKGETPGEPATATVHMPDGTARALEVRYDTTFVRGQETKKDVAVLLDEGFMAAAIAGDRSVRVTFTRGNRSRRLRMVGFEQRSNIRFLILDEEG
jgi:hypothetical protein